MASIGELIATRKAEIAAKDALKVRRKSDLRKFFKNSNAQRKASEFSWRISFYQLGTNGKRDFRKLPIVR